jgi:hypothetical protein
MTLFYSIVFFLIGMACGLWAGDFIDQRSVKDRSEERHLDSKHPPRGGSGVILSNKKIKARRQGKLKKLACYLAIVWVRVPSETRTYMVIIDPDEFNSETEGLTEARRLIDDYLSELDYEIMSIEAFEAGSDYIGVSRC